MMDDKELKEIFNEWEQFLSWCYENNDKTIEIHRDKAKYVMNYIRNLQSNWNSLREWLEENEDKISYMEDVINKMNELEGVDNNVED